MPNINANIQNMLNAISKGNHVLNETVRLYRNTESTCPDCTYDPIRKESTNPNCQTCDGNGKVIAENYYEVSASIETLGDYTNTWENVGQLTDNEIYVTLDIKEINETLNVSPVYDLDDYYGVKAFVESFNYLTWKGAKYNKNAFEAGYLQGILYEVGMKMALIDG